MFFFGSFSFSSRWNFFSIHICNFIRPGFIISAYASASVSAYAKLANFFGLICRFESRFKFVNFTINRERGVVCHFSTLRSVAPDCLVARVSLTRQCSQIFSFFLSSWFTRSFRIYDRTGNPLPSLAERNFWPCGTYLCISFRSRELLYLIHTSHTSHRTIYSRLDSSFAKLLRTRRRNEEGWQRDERDRRGETSRYLILPWLAHSRPTLGRKSIERDFRVPLPSPFLSLACPSLSLTSCRYSHFSSRVSHTAQRIWESREKDGW